jgi:hypothetical protein
LNGNSAQVEAGSSCHQCKSRRAHYELIYCTQQQRKKKGNLPAGPVGCRKKYCEHCLSKFYQEARPSEAAQKTWVCPSCRHECSCAACRKKGEETTGQWGSSGSEGRLREDRHTRTSSSRDRHPIPDVQYTVNPNKRTSARHSRPLTDYNDPYATITQSQQPRQSRAEAAADRENQKMAKAAAIAETNMNYALPPHSIPINNNPNQETITIPLNSNNSPHPPPQNRIDHLTFPNNSLLTTAIHPLSTGISPVMANSGLDHTLGSSPRLLSHNPFTFNTVGIQSPQQTSTSIAPNFLGADRSPAHNPTTLTKDKKNFHPALAVSHSSSPTLPPMYSLALKQTPPFTSTKAPNSLLPFGAQTTKVNPLTGLFDAHPNPLLSSLMKNGNGANMNPLTKASPGFCPTMIDGSLKDLFPQINNTQNAQQSLVDLNAKAMDGMASPLLQPSSAHYLQGHMAKAAQQTNEHSSKAHISQLPTSHLGQEDLFKHLNAYTINPPSSLFTSRDIPGSTLFMAQNLVAGKSSLLANLNKDTLTLTTKPASNTVILNVNGQPLFSLQSNEYGLAGKLNETNGLVQHQQQILQLLATLPDNINSNSGTTPTPTQTTTTITPLGLSNSPTSNNQTLKDNIPVPSTTATIATNVIGSTSTAQSPAMLSINLIGGNKNGPLSPTTLAPLAPGGSQAHRFPPLMLNKVNNGNTNNNTTTTTNHNNNNNNNTTNPNNNSNHVSSTSAVTGQFLSLTPQQQTSVIANTLLQILTAQNENILAELNSNNIKPPLQNPFLDNNTNSNDKNDEQKNYNNDDISVLDGDYIELKNAMVSKLNGLQHEHQSLLLQIDKLNIKINKNSTKGDKVQDYQDLIKILTASLRRLQTDINSIKYRLEIFTQKQQKTVANENVLAVFTLLWVLIHNPTIHQQFTEINSQNSNLATKLTKVHALLASNISASHSLQSSVVNPNGTSLLSSVVAQNNNLPNTTLNDLLSLDNQPSNPPGFRLNTLLHNGLFTGAKPSHDDHQQHHQQHHQQQQPQQQQQQRSQQNLVQNNHVQNTNNNNNTGLSILNNGVTGSDFHNTTHNHDHNQSLTVSPVTSFMGFSIGQSKAQAEATDNLNKKRKLTFGIDDEDERSRPIAPSALLDKL